MPQPNNTDRLSDPILRNMGLIIVIWSAFEIQMEFCILWHQKISLKTGLLLTTNLNYNAKAKLLQTFASEKSFSPESENALLKQLLRRAEPLYGKRNLIAHSSWTPTDDPLVANVMAIRTRGKLQLVNKEMSVSDLADTYEQIRKLGLEMNDFMERHNIIPEDSP